MAPRLAAPRYRWLGDAGARSVNVMPFSLVERAAVGCDDLFRATSPMLRDGTHVARCGVVKTMEREMPTYRVICVMLILAGAGCASSQGERVNDARMEQINENANASEKAADATETAREDAIEQQHNVAHAQIDSANPPVEGASQDLVKVSEERATYQSQAKARLNKVRIRLDAAQQKLSVLGSRAPTALQGELDTTSRQYQALERDVMSVNQIPATSWEATTGKINERLKGLDERVTDLSESIEASS